MHDRWDPGDLLALRVARRSLTQAAFRPTATSLSVQEVGQTLVWHKLIGIADPDDPALPLDQEGRSSLQTLQRLTAAQALKRIAVAARVRQCLNEAGIDCLFFKGVVLSEIVWGRPGARGAGDIDVLVEETRIEPALAALRGIGVRVPPPIADARPARLDRMLHHALCLTLDGVYVDLHYRLDPNPEVLGVPFQRLHDSGQELRIGGQPFRTLDDETTLLLLAANGGRDLWRKWGQVLDFAMLDRRLSISTAEARSYGVERRLELGRRMTDWLTGSKPVGPQRRLAAQIIDRHAKGPPATRWAQGWELAEDSVRRFRTAPSADQAKRSAVRLIATDDAAGRAPDSGLREHLVYGMRRIVRTDGRIDLEPAWALCDLIDASFEQRWDPGSFSVLDNALRADWITAEELFVLQLMAPLMQVHEPTHPFLRRAEGLQRRARVARAASEVLVRRLEDLAGPGVVLGDLGAARFLWDRSDRPVRSSTLCITTLTPKQAQALASQVASEQSGVIVPGRWPLVQRMMVQVMLHRSLSTGFDFRQFRGLIEQSPEMVFYSSIVHSALGGPRIAWYADAVAARDTLDWDYVWHIGHVAGWVEPVGRAASVLYTRGWDVPLRPAFDPVIDASYWHSRGNRRARSSWLVLRRARRLRPGPVNPLPRQR